MPTAERGRIGVRVGGNAGDLREVNLTRILGYVRDNGISSRHDIAAGVGLGISTMTDLIGELRSRRLVTELPPVRRPTAGRPTRPIALDGAPWLVLGVHLDVDKVEMNAATLGPGQTWPHEVTTDLRGSDGCAVVLDLLAKEFDRLPPDRRLCAVQFGVPGKVESSSGVVRWSAALDWRDIALGELVDRLLADAGLDTVHVGVAGDSQLAGLHAARVELRLPREATAVYLGGMRGMAGTVLIDGEIFCGASGAGGDLGHLNVDPAGEPCWCGRTGCLETFAGLRWILARSGLVPPEEAMRLAVAHPRQSTARLAEAADAGHERTLAALEQAAYGLSRAVDDLIGAVNPDTVILGGALGPLGRLLIPEIAGRLGSRLETGSLGLAPLQSVDKPLPRAVLGATLAARDAVLADPLGLTRVLE